METAKRGGKRAALKAERTQRGVSVAHNALYVPAPGSICACYSCARCVVACATRIVATQRYPLQPPIVGAHPSQTAVLSACAPAIVAEWGSQRGGRRLSAVGTALQSAPQRLVAVGRSLQGALVNANCGVSYVRLGRLSERSLLRRLASRTPRPFTARRLSAPRQTALRSVLVRPRCGSAC